MPLDFFNEPFVRALVLQSEPSAKVQSVIPFSFISGAKAKEASLIYVGFVLNAAGKIFHLGVNTFSIDATEDSGKGWLVFDSIEAGTNPLNCQFTGWKVTLQVPVKDADTAIVPPGFVGSPRVQWYTAAGTIWNFGTGANTEFVRIMDAAVEVVKWTVADGFVANKTFVSAAPSVTVEFLNGTTVINSSSLGSVAANRAMLNYWCEAGNFTFMNSAGAGNKQGISLHLSVSIEGVVKVFDNLPLGIKQTVFAEIGVGGVQCLFTVLTNGKLLLMQTSFIVYIGDSVVSPAMDSLELLPVITAGGSFPRPPLAHKPAKFIPIPKKAAKKALKKAAVKKARGSS